MKRMPTVAKRRARRLRLRTAKRSAVSPCIPAGLYWPSGQTVLARRLAGRLESAAVIERDQVLHVARLARLGLSEEEVEAMAVELSGILEHVDRIAELDFEGVEPTSEFGSRCCLGAGARSCRRGVSGSVPAGRGLDG
jgi:hypothetical protein